MGFEMAASASLAMTEARAVRNIEGRRNAMGSVSGFAIMQGQKRFRGVYKLRQASDASL